MSDDLTERLRQFPQAEWWRSETEEPWTPARDAGAITNEAARRIDTLTAERDALRSLLAGDVSWALGELAAYAQDWSPVHEARVSDLIARVREALGDQ